MVLEISPDEYVSSRRIGDAIVTLINDSTEPWKPELDLPEEEWRPLVPGLDEQGRLPIAMHVAHIRIGDASILVDTGLEDTDSGWWQRHRQESPEAIPTPGVPSGLASMGVRPEDITHIIITHAHWDHIVGLAVERNGEYVPRYPNARVLIGRGDWEGNEERSDPRSEAAIRLGAIERHGSLQLVEGDLEVVPGVTILHTPGESPGHSVVRVESNGERFYALGDLFHMAPEVEHLDWNVPWADSTLMRASRERVLHEVVPTGAALMFTHEPFPGWGKIVHTDTGYRWERG